MRARVAIEHRTSYVLYGDDGTEFTATLSGKLRHHDKKPAVGDWVNVRDTVIEDVLPRRSKIVRKAAGDGLIEQVIAANIDTVFVVSGLDHDFNVRRLERYFITVRSSGAQCVFLLNKSDLCDDPDGRAQEVRGIAPGADVIVISALHGDVLSALRQYLIPDETVALVGSSGAGKSTLINRLIGFDRQATAAVREDDSRGRHTTTCRELIRTATGAMLIDTPGLRELQLWASEEQIEAAFPDMENIAAQCRFRNCSHAGEEGCAVQAGLADGSLDRDRYESFLKMRKEAAYLDRQIDTQAQLAEKTKWKKIHKAQRDIYKHGKH